MPASASPNSIATSQIVNAYTDAATPEDHIVIVGAGMAGSRLAIQLATAHQQSDNTTNTTNTTNATKVSVNAKTNIVTAPKITLISKELEVGYNRIMLSPVLAGETAFDDTYLYDKADYERLGINVIAGVCVEHIDTQHQQLLLDNGQTLEYDKLVLATGSTARVILFPNHDSKGVHVFRDVADVTTLTDYAKQGKTGLVIGGGVLGLEAACALSAQGATMTVIHVDGYVLNRQLDLPAALMLQEELARRNVGLEVLAATTSIEKNEAGEVTGLSLKDGRTLPADFIVMAVGIIPNTKLASDSGIKVNRGIVVDNYMRTNCANVYAIGECIEINEELFGMVSSVNQHIDTLMSMLTQPDNKPNWQPFVSVPLSLKLKVSGIAVFSAGQIEFDDAELEGIEQVIYRQSNPVECNNSHYQCLYLQGNRLIGAVLYGETSEGNFYSQLINEKIDISTFRDDLIYGAAYCTASLDLNETGVEGNDVVTTLDVDAGVDAVTDADTDVTTSKSPKTQEASA